MHVNWSKIYEWYVFVESDSILCSYPVTQTGPSNTNGPTKHTNGILVKPFQPNKTYSWAVGNLGHNACLILCLLNKVFFFRKQKLTISTPTIITIPIADWNEYKFRGKPDIYHCRSIIEIAREKVSDFLFASMYFDSINCFQIFNLNWLQKTTFRFWDCNFRRHIV